MTESRREWMSVGGESVRMKMEGRKEKRREKQTRPKDVRDKRGTAGTKWDKIYFRKKQARTLRLNSIRRVRFLPFVSTNRYRKRGEEKEREEYDEK